MSGFTECPNCAKDKIMVPLRPDGDSMVCSLCQLIFPTKVTIHTV